MTDKTYDVAVVGASIAGCTAATLLAREGASVALIERHCDPNAYKALCTHFIQPSAVPTMERLGLLPLIEAAGAVPNEIDMWTRWGWIRNPEGVSPRLQHPPRDPRPHAPPPRRTRPPAWTSCPARAPTGC